jgi:hypothetical protein
MEIRGQGHLQGHEGPLHGRSQDDQEGLTWLVSAGATRTAANCWSDAHTLIFWMSIPRISLPAAGLRWRCWSSAGRTTPSACMAWACRWDRPWGWTPGIWISWPNLVERIDPVRVSDHASFARGHFHGAVVHAADLLPLPFTTEALDVLWANVGQVQDRLRRLILVENLSAYLAWNASDEEQAWSETSFLTELARRSGCQLLVAVNNIYVDALNAQMAGRLTDFPPYSSVAMIGSMRFHSVQWAICILPGTVM